MTDGFKTGKCTPYQGNWEFDATTTPQKEFEHCAQYDNLKDCQTPRLDRFGLDKNRKKVKCWWDETYPYGCCYQVGGPVKAGTFKNCHKLDRTGCFTEDTESCQWGEDDPLYPWNSRCGAKSCGTKCTPEQCKSAKCELTSPFACLNENNEQLGCKPNSNGWDVPGPNPCTSCCDVRSCK